MTDNLYFETAGLRPSASEFTGLYSRIDQVPDVPLQPASKILVQSGTAGQHDILVQSSSYVDGRRLNNCVNDVR
jgi:hypothetical protein